MDVTDSSYDTVISAYADWRAVPAFSRRYYFTGTAEDGNSITPEIAADPSMVVGRYRAARFRVAFYDYYTGAAFDDNEPAVETQNPSMVVGMRYHPTHYKPLPFHRLIQYGDEGQQIVHECEGRATRGTPTPHGLRRYQRSTVAHPRPQTFGGACEDDR